MLSNDQLARLVQDFYNLMLERESTYGATGVFLSEEQREHRALVGPPQVSEIAKVKLHQFIVA